MNSRGWMPKTIPVPAAKLRASAKGTMTTEEPGADSMIRTVLARPDGEYDFDACLPGDPLRQVSEP